MQHYRLFEYRDYLVYLFFENMLSLNKNTTIFLIFSMILITGCGDSGFFKKPDWSEPAIDGKELARKNVREGKGIQIKPNKEQEEIFFLHPLIQCGELRLKQLILCLF